MQHSLANCFGRILTPRANYSVYFLKGTDSRMLSPRQQSEIAQLVKQQPLSSSFMVFNSWEADRRLQAWNTRLPWIKPFYAIKSNPIGLLLRDLASKGTGLDCASRTEIQLALDQGVSASDIVYSNPVKDENDLKWAEAAGIRLTTADTFGELQKIQQLAPSMKVLWRIAIKEEATDKLSTPFSGKFGDDFEGEQDIHKRMSDIRKMGTKLEGIHFHCGSGQHGSSTFGKAVNLARSCLKIGRKYGHTMETLDVGGGFPAGDLSDKTVDALSVTHNDPLGYRVIAEPGRHFSAHTFYLLTRVLGKRVKSGKTCYHLNESLYHSFNGNLMDGLSFENSDQFYSKISASAEQAQIGEYKNCSLFGMTCDGMDVITKNLQVPESLEISDWLCISGMGAYTYGPRSTFNGMNSTDKIYHWTADLSSSETVAKEPSMVM